MRKRTQMSLLVMTGLLSTGLGGCGTPKTQTAPETGNSESQSVQFFHCKRKPFRCGFL